MVSPVSCETLFVRTREALSLCTTPSTPARHTPVPGTLRTAQKVFKLLVSKGQLQLGDIVRGTSMNPNIVKQALLILIQQNCINSYLQVRQGRLGVDSRMQAGRCKRPIPVRVPIRPGLDVGGGGD